MARRKLPTRIFAARASVAGSGSVNGAGASVSGAGALASPIATLDGDGQVGRVGAGVLAAQAAQVYGTSGGTGVIDYSIVPTLSRTIWDPGIPEGIPPDDANPATRLDGAGPAIQHGATIAAGASAATIQAALNAAGAVATKASRRFVQLGPGTFTITTTLSIPSYVILRGTSTGPGNRQTIIRGSGSAFNNVSHISISGGGAWGTVRNVVGIAWRGSSTITVDNASDFNVGDVLTIDQLNDGSYAGNRPITYTDGADGHWCHHLSSGWYSRQPYSYGAGVENLFPNASDGYRHVCEKVEVLGKSGNTLTIWNGQRGRGKPLHMTYYNAPQIYRSAGTGSLAEYAGVENLRIEPTGTNGKRVLRMDAARYCWFRNIESVGNVQPWAGVHAQLYWQTYRCEVRECYFHHSGNYNQNQNAYGLLAGGTNNLIEDNIFHSLNKPFFFENSGGGNVVAYNFADNAVIGSLSSGSSNEAALSSHAAYCHHELFEGNQSANIGFDSTHGNNGFNTIFRNWSIGHTTIGPNSYYRRAIFSDGFSMDLNCIGNVLGSPARPCTSLFIASTGPTQYGNGENPNAPFPSGIPAYLIGSNSWVMPVYPYGSRSAGSKPGSDFFDDGTAYSFFHRHLDYVYGYGQYSNPANAVTTLPDSLYLTSKPAFFGSYDWPWVNPQGANDAARIKTLPAKARYDAGTP